MSYVEAVLLGFVQGVSEWLPISSEGLVTILYAMALGNPVSEATSFALWLHTGTALSVIAAFRTEVRVVFWNLATRKYRPSRLSRFLILATVTSAPLGLVLLTVMGELTGRAGSFAMAIVGIMMLVTGVVLLQRHAAGSRTRDNSNRLDAALTGLAQGFAVIPGLSRSGLTVSVLLARGFNHREALTLSMLMSVPASVGAGLYGAIETGAYASPQAVIALAVAAAVGFVTIRALLKLARRLELGWFVVVVGAAITIGALWQALV